MIRFELHRISGGEASPLVKGAVDAGRNLTILPALVSAFMGPGESLLIVLTNDGARIEKITRIDLAVAP